MTPKQFSGLALSKVQDLETLLSELDHRSLDEKIEDALNEGVRRLHAIPAVALQRGLMERAREEHGRAAGLLRGLPLDRAIMEPVEKLLVELAQDADKVGNEPDEKTAYHESGHLVVGYYRGAKVGDLTCCECKHPEVGLIWGFAQIEDYPSVEAEVVTLLAGPLAEARFTASRTLPQNFRFDTTYVPTWGDPLDRINLRVPCDPQTSTEFRVALETLRRHDKGTAFGQCMMEAQSLLNQRPVWAAIEALAKVLFKVGSLPGEEAVHIISDFLQPAKP